VNRLVAALVGFVVVLCGLGATAAHTAAADASPGRVVLVGVAGLEWADVSGADTPTLYELMAKHTAGSVAVRSVAFATCVNDGWLTIGAGQRAVQDRRDFNRCWPQPTPVRDSTDSGVVSATVPRWEVFQATQQEGPYDATIGLLGQTLAGAGACATAVGRGAALALADEQGRVQRYVAELNELTPQIIAECPVMVVDLGGLPHPGDVDARRAAVRAFDAELTRVRGLLDDETALLVAGVADSWVTNAPVRNVTDEPPPLDSQIAPIGLRVGVAAGPQPTDGTFGARWLTSPSTRWDGLVILADLSSTLLAYAGVDTPERMVGHAWQPGEPHPTQPTETLRQLLGASTAADVFKSQSGPFFQYLGLIELLLFGTAYYLFGRSVGRPRRRVLLRSLGLFALTAASLPVASFLANLVPWWLFDHPALTLWPLMLAIAIVLALVAAYGPWRSRAYGPTAFVAGVTATVLGVDVAFGSNLQHSSLLGLSPLTAGRFYGFGNIAYAVFVTACLVLAGSLAQWIVDRGGVNSRSSAVVVVTLIGGAAVVLDGAPFAGADFGGVIASICGFSLLGLSLLGTRPSWPRLIAIALAAVLVVAAIAVFDWARPAASRTHLGDFVQQVIDGDAWSVVWRKGLNALGTFDRPFYGWLVPLAYVVIIAMVRNPVRMHVPGLAEVMRQWPLLRPLIWAGLVTGAVGFAANDSGVIVPALMLTVGIPLVVAAVARAHRLLLDGKAPPRVEPETAVPSRSPTRSPP
jgi:hypothetical protein